VVPAVYDSTNNGLFKWIFLLVVFSCAVKMLLMLGQKNVMCCLMLALMLAIAYAAMNQDPEKPGFKTHLLLAFVCVVLFTFFGVSVPNDDHCEQCIGDTQADVQTMREHLLHHQYLHKVFHDVWGPTSEVFMKDTPEGGAVRRHMKCWDEDAKKWFDCKWFTSKDIKQVFKKLSCKKD